VRLTFWFDPSCKWTWRTSRWLVRVAELEGHTIVWEPLSLPHLHDADDVDPADQDDATEAARRAGRLVERLTQAGDQGAVARFYAAYGLHRHARKERASAALVLIAAGEAGLGPEVVAAVDDAGLDEAVARRTDQGVEAAGGGVGSPLLRLGDGPVFFGPIITEVPGDEAAVRLLRTVEAAMTEPVFLELKRGRG
jgi:mycothiol-dependent nitroreductase-like protein